MKEISISVGGDWSSIISFPETDAFFIRATVNKDNKQVYVHVSQDSYIMGEATARDIANGINEALVGSEISAHDDINIIESAFVQAVSQ